MNFDQYQNMDASKNFQKRNSLKHLIANNPTGSSMTKATASSDVGLHDTSFRKRPLDRFHLQSRAANHSAMAGGRSMQQKNSRKVANQANTHYQLDNFALATHSGNYYNDHEDGSGPQTQFFRTNDESARMM